MLFTYVFFWNVVNAVYSNWVPAEFGRCVRASKSQQIIQTEKALIKIWNDFFWKEIVFLYVRELSNWEIHEFPAETKLFVKKKTYTNISIECCCRFGCCGACNLLAFFPYIFREKKKPLNYFVISIFRATKVLTLSTHSPENESNGTKGNSIQNKIKSNVTVGWNCDHDSIASEVCMCSAYSYKIYKFCKMEKHNKQVYWII